MESKSLDLFSIFFISSFDKNEYLYINFAKKVKVEAFYEDMWYTLKDCIALSTLMLCKGNN